MAVEFVTIKVWAKTLAKLKKLAYLTYLVAQDKGVRAKLCEWLLLYCEETNKRHADERKKLGLDERKGCPAFDYEAPFSASEIISFRPLPLVEKATIQSSGPTRPRSPCMASPG